MRYKKIITITEITFILSLFLPVKAFPQSSLISYSLHSIFKVEKGIRGLAFTPYGNILASYGDDKTIKLWDLKKEVLLRTFKGHTKPVNSIAVSPDQRHLASVSDDKTVRIWDFESGKMLYTLKSHSRPIYAVSFSPDGKMLASGGEDKLIRLWNVKTGTSIGYLEGHEKKVHSLAFSYDGQMLTSASEDNTIRLWDVIKRREKRSIVETASRFGKLNVVSFSTGLDIIAMGLTEVKRESGSRRARAGPPVWNYLIKLRNGLTGEEVGSLSGHLQAVTAISISHDGRFIASGSPDHTVRLWDVERMSEITNISQKAEVTSVAFSPDGHWLAASGKDKKISIWEITGVQPLLPMLMAKDRKETKKFAGTEMTEEALSKGNKYAVIIGVGKYLHQGVSTLQYTVADAKAMYNFLISPTGGKIPKDNIKLLLDKDATLKNIKTALGIFLARNAQKNDTVLIFYAGHGAPETDMAGKSDDGLEKYIIPYDADPDLLFATALPMSDIETIFQRIESKQVVFFLDSCYSGAAGGRTFLSSKLRTRGIRITGRFLEKIAPQGSGRAIISASRPNELSLELDDLRHGLFTYYLLEGLKGKADNNGDGFITLKEVYDYLEDKVSARARKEGGNQHPVMTGSFSGKIVLATK